jgi:hypothetical protein
MLSRFTFLTFGYIYKHNLGNHWSFGIFWAHGFCSGSRRKKLQTMRFKTPDGLCPHVKPKPRTRIELIDADWWFAILFQGCLRIWEEFSALSLLQTADLQTITNMVSKHVTSSMFEAGRYFEQTFLRTHHTALFVHLRGHSTVENFAIQSCYAKCRTMRQCCRRVEGCATGVVCLWIFCLK